MEKDRFLNKKNLVLKETESVEITPDFQHCEEEFAQITNYAKSSTDQLGLTSPNIPTPRSVQNLKNFPVEKILLIKSTSSLPENSAQDDESCYIAEERNKSIGESDQEENNSARQATPSPTQLPTNPIEEKSIKNASQNNTAEKTSNSHTKLPQKDSTKTSNNLNIIGKRQAREEDSEEEEELKISKIKERELSFQNTEFTRDMVISSRKDEEEKIVASKDRGVNPSAGSVEGMSVIDEYSFFSTYVCQTRFDIPDYYSLIKPLGQGGYGVVCKAYNKIKNHEYVAIKKVVNVGLCFFGCFILFLGFSE
jgi:hypothetical protein